MSRFILAASVAIASLIIATARAQQTACVASEPTNYCVAKFGDARTWSSARDMCPSRSFLGVTGRLAVIRNGACNAAVPHGGHAWIGLYASAWFDGSPRPYTNWYPGEPSGDGACAYMFMFGSYRWNDEPCSFTKGYVCDYTFPANTCDAHCNGHAASQRVVATGSSFACECTTCIAGYRGARCDRCAAGFAGYPTCRACSSAADCSDHAVAVASDGTACQCTCHWRYTGARCDQCASRLVRYPACETATPSLSPTASPNPSTTATRSESDGTLSATPAASSSDSLISTLSATAAGSPTVSRTPRHSASTSSTPSVGPTSSASLSGSTSGTSTPSVAPTTSLSPSVSAETPSATGALSQTASDRLSGSLTLTVTPSASPSPSASSTQPVSGSESGSDSASHTASATLPVEHLTDPVRLVADAAQHAARGIALATVGLSGTPAVATQAARIEALMAVLDCRDEEAEMARNNGAETVEDAERPAWSAHPLRFRAPWAGSGAASWAAAVVVGDCSLLFAAVPALVLGLAAPLRLLWGRYVARKKQSSNPVPTNYRYTLSRALTWCRFPGVLALAAAFLLPPVAQHGALLISAFIAPPPSAVGNDDSANGVGLSIGVAGLVAVLAAHVVGAIAYARYFAATFVWHEAADDPFDIETAAARVEATAKAPTPAAGSEVAALGDRMAAHVRVGVGIDAAAEWAARAGSTATGTLSRQFGMFFDAFGPRAPWFLLADLAVACASELLAGLADAIGCVALAWLLSAVALVYALLVTGLRPHAAPLDLVLYVAVAWLQAGAAVTAAAAPLRVAVGAQAAASLGVSALGLYELAKAVFVQWTQRVNRRRLRAASASPRATSALLDSSLLDVPGDVPPGCGDDGGGAQTVVEVIGERGDEFCDGTFAEGDADVVSAALDLADLLAGPQQPQGKTRRVRRRQRTKQPIRERVLTEEERAAELERLAQRQMLADLLGHAAEADVARARAAALVARTPAATSPEFVASGTEEETTTAADSPTSDDDDGANIGDTAMEHGAVDRDDDLAAAKALL